MIRYSNGYAAMAGPAGEVIPEAVSRDSEFVRLVRTIQSWRNSGRFSDDDALASIAELVDVAVEAAFMPGAGPPAEIAASDTDEAAEHAIDQYIADIWAALGEPTIWRLYLDDRAEFDRRREAGTSLEESVATRPEARGHGYGRR